jgi:hypothetical protein
LRGYGFRDHGFSDQVSAGLQLDFRRLFHPKMDTPYVFYTVRYNRPVVIRRKNSVFLLLTVSVWMGVDSVAPTDYLNGCFFVH